ncbi:MAG: MFS transporter [Candidatus Acetothermia bacterium]|nr:MFS transporter [Candidatus Acetothermia bacterium]
MDGPPTSWKRRFFTIWTGQQVSLFGSQSAQFALVWWLTQETGSATVLATATPVAMLPPVVLGPFAGALIDRLNRRRVMIAADAAIALVSTGLAYLYWTGAIQVWHVYLAMAVRAVGGGFRDQLPRQPGVFPAPAPREGPLRGRGARARLAGVGVGGRGGGGRARPERVGWVPPACSLPWPRCSSPGR